MIIGLGYNLQSGKDQTAIFIKEYLESLGFPCVIDSFATSMKNTLIDLFPQIKHENVWGTNDQKNAVIDGLNNPFDKSKPCTGRIMMQWFATDVCRSVYDNIWVNSLAERAASQPGKLTITSDMRFMNEAEYIQSCHGMVVKVDPTYPDWPGHFKSETTPHASEIGLEFFENWDWIIENDSDLESLKAKAIELADAAIIPRLRKEGQ